MKHIKEDNQIKKLLISLVPVQAIAVGLPAINTLLNGFVAGHYFGPSGLAAIGFAGPLTYLFSMISSTLAIGSQVKSGHQIGCGDQDGLSHTFSTTCISALVVGLVISGLLMIFRNAVSIMLGTSDELMEMTRNYLFGLAPGVFFSIIFSVLLSFLQLERAEKTATAAIVVQLVVNTGLNFVNVYILHWDLFGVALSTTAANLAAVLICLIYFVCRESVFCFSLRRFDLKAIKEVLYLGFPSALEPACYFIRDRILNQVVFALGGTTAMAAMSIVSNFNNGIGTMISGGFTGASNLISSVLVGERDVDSLRSFPKIIIKTMFPVIAGAYILLFVFARPLALFFGAEPEMIGLYVMVIRCNSLWYLTDSLKVPSFSVYQSLGRIKETSIFTILMALMVPVTVILAGKVLGFGFLVHFSWIAEAGLVAAYVIYYYMKRRKLPSSIYTMTDIPHTMAVPSEDRCSATIKKIKDATDASEKMEAFCISKGLSSKTATMCGLCVEEIAVDCIIHGFTKEKADSYSIEL